MTESTGNQPVRADPRRRGDVSGNWGGVHLLP